MCCLNKTITTLNQSVMNAGFVKFFFLESYFWTICTLASVQLTIRPVALSGYGSISHEARLMGRVEGSNCFSITQLVGQKRTEKAIINK